MRLDLLGLAVRLAGRQESMVIGMFSANSPCLQQHVTVGRVGGSVSLVVELAALNGILDETGVVGDPTRPEWHEDYAKLSKGKDRLF